MTANKLALFFGSVSAMLLAACTFLVQFDDKESDEEEDAGVVVRPDAQTPRVDGGPDAPVGTNPCNGQLDGARVSGAPDTTRCCGGQVTDLTKNESCGVCGFRCQDTQQCSLVWGRYYCRGCNDDGQALDSRCSDSTNCCSRNFDTVGVCAASTCGRGGGPAVCDVALCSARGASCDQPISSGSSFSCYYP